MEIYDATRAHERARGRIWDGKSSEAIDEKSGKKRAITLTRRPRDFPHRRPRERERERDSVGLIARNMPGSQEIERERGWLIRDGNVNLKARRFTEAYFRQLLILSR